MGHQRAWIRATVGATAVAWLVALAGCGGSDGDDSVPATGTQVAPIGPAGGTAHGPGGAQVAVPSGALSQFVNIAIEATDAGAPALAADMSPVGKVFAFTPHGTAFAQPVTVTVPFDPALLPAGATPALYKTAAGQASWETVLGAAVNGTSMVGQVNGFSHFVVAIPPLTKNEPRYDWEFSQILGNGPVPIPLPGGSGTQVGGVLSKFADFGPHPFDATFTFFDQTSPQDYRASGYLFAQGNGVTYGGFAEAPMGRVRTPDPIGSKSRLTQLQSFRKIAPDATLSFTLTHVTLRLQDFQPLVNQKDVFVQADAMLSVGAFHHNDPTKYFYYRGGRVTAWGEAHFWFYRANNFSFSRGELWTDDLFDFDVYDVSYTLEEISCPGKEALIKLKQPRTYVIDLSSVAVGEEFTVRSDIDTATLNRKGGGRAGDCNASYAISYLRDPLSMGGTTIETTGLLPTNNPIVDTPPRDAYEPPATCPGGTLAAAGTLQFSAGFYEISEAAGSAPSILVTRAGGNQGAVSATFATADGTGRAGVDYQPVLTTVHFGDGDSGVRVVELPVIANDVDEPDRTVLVSLSEPGGCSALGEQRTVVLTIVDDDPPPLFTLGGTVTGLVGTGLVIDNISTDALPILVNGSFQFGRTFSTGSVYRVRVVTQPQNPRQVCEVRDGEGTIATANVTNVEIACTTLPESGSLDPSFGTGGRVWTSDPTARADGTALALQADGKLLTVSGGNRLMRHLPDGTRDPAFGTAGDGVVTVTSGQRFAYVVRGVAVQPDGRILVAGYAPDGVSGRPDMLVARYQTDGTLDSSFATGQGIASFDYATWSDGAEDILLQSDGSILLIGNVSDGGINGSDFAVLRLTSTGQVDSAFGIGGWARANVAGAFDVPAAGALMPDGGIVLAGRVATSGGANADVGLVRFTAAGNPDPSFGSSGNGIVRPITSEHEEARDVAVLADGAILVVGVKQPSSGAYALWLARYLPNGQPDIGFGSSGLATLTTPMGGYALVEQADGTVLVAGEVSSADGTHTDFGIARFKSSGEPDSSFGIAGLMPVDMFGSFDTSGAMVLQPDGRLVVGGQARNGSSLGLGLVRLFP